MPIIEKNISSIRGLSRVGKIRPTILLIDSGVGGLSVYEEVRQLLPDARYLYLFDNDAFPYGEKSEQTIVERVVAMTAVISQQYPISLAIIACNTASTISLPALRAKFNFAVVGVVPAIKPAAKLTRNGVVGLLATQGTVRRAYTQQLVEQFASACRIEMIGSSRLVELAELKLQGETITPQQINEVVAPWRRLPEPPDTVVLGCTHFPLLKVELQQALAPGTRLIDSGAAIARRAIWLVQQLAPLDASTGENLAFCTRLDQKTEQLRTVLEAFGINTLKKVTI